MLAQERKNSICEIVNREKAVSVTELAEQLNASESTIRRDLVILDQEHRLTKVRGGATSLAQEFISDESDMLTKSELNIAEKAIIGRYTATLIYDDDVVYIDAGTTTLQLAEAIEKSRAIFVTNGIQHADLLSRKGCRVYLLGGQLKAITSAVIGAEAIRSIRQYNFTKCFLGVNGVTRLQGLTTPDPEEALVKKAAYEQAFMTYALADHTKFNKVFAARITEISNACIITDKLTDRSLAKETVIKEAKEVAQ